MAVLEGAEPDERGLSGGAYVWAMPVGVEDERWRTFATSVAKVPRACAPSSSVRGSWQKRMSISPASAMRWEAAPLECGRPVPAASCLRRTGAKRAAVGETAQAAEPEARSRRQVVQSVAERHRAGRGRAGVGARERLGVVVVSFHKQKLETGTAEQGTGGEEEAAPFRVAQVAEVAERYERVAALLDGAPDQAAQVASVGVQVAEDKQPTHSSRA